MSKRKKRVVTIGEGVMPEYDAKRHALVFVEYRKGVRHEVRVTLNHDNGWFAWAIARAALEAMKSVRERKRVSWQRENERMKSIEEEAGK